VCEAPAYHSGVNGSLLLTGLIHHRVMDDVGRESGVQQQRGVMCSVHLPWAT
jgi:hypothetical protein